MICKDKLESTFIERTFGNKFPGKTNEHDLH